MSDNDWAKVVFPWRKAVNDDRDLLSANAKHIALTLATNWINKHGVCFPEVETIALTASRHPRTVQRGLAELERRGFLHIEHGGGRGKTNTYTALIPAETSTPEKGGTVETPATSPKTPATSPKTPAENPVKGGTVPPELDLELDKELDSELGAASGAAHDGEPPRRWTPLKADRCVICDTFGMVDGELRCAEHAEGHAA
jgi:hypothetical protein